ncbi:hypothetical protein [Streptomyces sp. NPDC056323]|uniref:hypothetical protein n=1 Tax=unclassified Streptomyces TaxID=2593676 RepID=UPI0035DF77B4
MAVPLSASAVLTALRAEGVRLVELGNRRAHHRNQKGAWGPLNGSIVRHTVTRGTSSTAAMVRAALAQQIERLSLRRPARPVAVAGPGASVVGPPGP